MLNSVLGLIICLYWFLKMSQQKCPTVAFAYNPRVWEAEKKSQIGLYSKFKVILGDLARSYLKKKQTNENPSECCPLRFCSGFSSLRVDWLPQCSAFVHSVHANLLDLRIFFLSRLVLDLILMS